jgi:hypothetical protein
VQEEDKVNQASEESPEPLLKIPKKKLKDDRRGTKVYTAGSGSKKLHKSKYQTPFGEREPQTAGIYPQRTQDTFNQEAFDPTHTQKLQPMETLEFEDNSVVRAA